MQQQEYPTEDLVPQQQHHEEEHAQDEALKEARIAAARAKAEAAKAAVERRRSLQSRDSHDNPTADAQAAAAAAANSRKVSSATPKEATFDDDEDMYPTEKPASAVQTRAIESNQDRIDRIHREYEQLQHDDDTLEERLQLQSEIITLHKELAVVQEDEARLRTQLAATEELIAHHDPEVAKEVAILEDEAQHSSLEKLWSEECLNNCPDKMDWENIDISNLMDRLHLSRKDFSVANEKAEALYAQQEAKINENTDKRDHTKANLTESYKEEMSSLSEARALLRQREDEKAFHQKRGTTRRGELNVVPADKKSASRQRCIDDAEGRTTTQVDTMNSQLTELMEECKVLKRRLECTRQENEKKKAVCDVELAGIETEGSDAREFKEKLIKENKELIDLKADLQGVLNYVRVKRREEEEL